jgi:cell wall-associated NlpC family hydrolase
VSAQSVKRPLLAGVLLLALASCPLVEQYPITVRSTPAAAVSTAVKSWPQLQPVSGGGLTAAPANPVAATPKPSTKSKARKTAIAGVAVADTASDLAPASSADLQASTAAEVALSFALDQLGKPYEWGAEGPDTFDCSGLTMRAYEAAGYQLPRTAAEQAMVGTPVNVADLLPGDLLFYATDPSDLSTVHHVVMYAGSGLVVHAPHTGDVVRLGPMWLGEEFAGAVRIVDAAPAELASAPTKARPNHSAAPRRRVLPVARPTQSPAPTKAPSDPGSSPSATPTSSPAAPITPPEVTPSVVPDSPAPTPTAVEPSVVPDSPAPTPSDVPPSVVADSPAPSAVPPAVVIDPVITDPIVTPGFS